MSSKSPGFSSQIARRKDDNDLMAEQKQEEQSRRADKEVRKRLLSGVKFVRTLMLSLPAHRRQTKFSVVDALAPA